jgi:hypothetical protein
MDTYYTFEIKDNGDFNLHQDSFYYHDDKELLNLINIRLHA